MARLVDCPNGHGVKPIPVVFGMPDLELLANAAAGGVRLGGCHPTFSNDRVGDCPVCGAAIPGDGRPDGRPADIEVADQPSDGAF